MSDTIPGTKLSEPAAVFAAHDGAERPEWALSDERLPLFECDGPDGERITVTMPAKPNPKLALIFLREARKIGAELAVSWLIEEAIGSEGYDALADELGRMPDPENASKVVQAIGQKVQRVVMGGLEGPKA